ncbi:protein HGH1 homolog [Copidosoma floridanum]|uniref:protein HGH1 homolog n=1 Tax=Copidosoma floridanum TaxID=29053 RepID=UPI0006C9854A|nr:protein HGH1 homolog [Copidosoma floridanum]
MESLKEISPFLDPTSRLDLKAVALEHVLGVTGTPEGRQLLLGIPEIVRQLILLLQDESFAIAKDASLALINISGDEEGASALLIISEVSKCSSDKKTDNLILLCFKYITDKGSKLADPCCMILSNMTRPKIFVDRIIILVEKLELSWNDLLNALTKNNYNSVGAKLHYLGPIFSNITQSRRMRDFLLNKDQKIIQRLLPFVEYKDSIVRRGGVVGTLRNCCFEEDNHEWLLSPDVDILTYLLLPLAGPEEFTDEENNKLPIDLQYLPETKERERDPDIRTMLLEALAQLCATKSGRELMRENNAYIILRELHKCERDKAILLACENVVDILIKTEEEIGLDNLKKVEVPEEYKEKFLQMDRLYLEDEEGAREQEDNEKKAVKVDK